ncbi:MAG: phenylalanine--tRNA ligase subunit beta, partial [Muribaculaceae bacterium]|nr:phenylalanine--tRNA ligase subunit beta [Muribaculaceae bacterium]
CDTERPMCIAGVFGGLDSGVTEGATSIFLESACFNPTRVRKTARRHGLNTDASFRYERGVDPNNTMYVLKLAAILVKELAGGEICGEPVDIYPNVVEPAKVDLSYDYLNRLVGKDIPQETVDSILKSLEIEIKGKSGDVVSLEVPTYRVDVTRPCDVVEEVLRFYGYNNVEIASDVNSSLSYKTTVDAADDMRRLISEQLTAAGFNEILNNSLTAESYYDGLENYPVEKCVKLLNPLSSDLNVMRQTLLFGGLESLAHNINRKQPHLAMYEFGNVYFLNPAAESTDEAPLAPFSEHASLALWMTGNIQAASWNRQAIEATVYDLRAVVQNIFNRLGIEDREIVFTVDNNPLYSASLRVDTRSGKKLATLGILSKAILKKADIKQPVCYAEIEWDAVVKLALKKKVKFAPLPKTQAVNRDLALLVDAGVTMEAIEKVVRESEKRLLKNIRLFDVYEGKNLPEGKKSYAIAIELQDEEKTMNDRQIDAIMSKIIENLKNKLGAQLR